MKSYLKVIFSLLILVSTLSLLFVFEMTEVRLSGMGIVFFILKTLYQKAKYCRI